MTEWEWYDDPNTFRLFIHLLLKVNHKEKKWHGITVKRGSFITGYDKLTSELNLSKQQIRTSISKLKSTGEITYQSTHHHSVATIVNYDSYQDRGKTPTHQATPTATPYQQADNTLSTPTKNVKKEKNVKNKDICNGFDYSNWPSLPSKQTLSDWYLMREKMPPKVSQTMISNLTKQFTLAANNGMTTDECLGEMITRGWKGFKYEWTESGKNKTNEINFDSTGWEKR